MLRIKDLNKSFGEKRVLVDVNLDINKGEIVMITGESGVGKTTLIRCLCGLESYESGQIEFVDTDDSKENSIGLVSQGFDLFPHFNVMKNITYPLIKAKNYKKADAKSKAMELVNFLGLNGLEENYECQLSGGQKQRVAIARALAMEPQYICFDEPTSALDYKLRDSVGKLIETVASRGMGVIVITHDREFAKKYADKVFELGA
ncbi:MAG TPA: ATP-binding cassette domain-containing protein [Tissierellaceae bacterium]|nr:ATP-binding cassette domain-containing protein [Tissierellaceae bacterium]